MSRNLWMAGVFRRGSLVVASVLMLATAGWAQTTFYFPQIADGGTNQTTIFITNPGASTTTANVTMTFTKSDGSAFGVTFTDQTGAQRTSPIGLQIAGGKSFRLVSTATGELQQGFATVVSDIAVTGSAVFSLFGGPPQTSSLVAEAGVNASPAVLDQAIFVDETPPFTTAIAYANPSATMAATVNFSLLNTEGVSIQTTARMLGAMRHEALFVNGLFTNSPVTDHVGTMQIRSDTALTTVSLRFAGSLFTSVPRFTLIGMTFPLEGWFAPKAWPAPLATFARVLSRVRTQLLG